jgi:hypothetical protein
MSSAATDRNLLFGVLVLQADLIDPSQFAEACSAWAARKVTPLADLLVERFRGLIKLLLKDSVLPQDDKGESKGRDTQFELYLAAICQSASLLPMDYAEPDVLFTVDRKRFAIAAKRLKRLDSAEKHIRKAANQIAESHHPGIIAFDLSIALNPDNRASASQFDEIRFRLEIDQFYAQYGQRICTWLAGKNVLAILAFHTYAHATLDQNWELVGLHSWLATSFDDYSKKEYDRLYYAFANGIPNVIVERE